MFNAIVGKLLAEEEAKLLNLFSQQEETAKDFILSPSVQPESPL
jgi:hypothetical protein